MKRTKALTLFAMLLASLFTAEYAAAQGEVLVEIINNSGEKRKICIYKGEDRVLAVPQKCFAMNIKEKAMWNRDGDNTYFHVKVFRPAIVDKFLYTKLLPASTWVMEIGAGNTFAYSTNKSNQGVTKYSLKVCNRRFDQKIYFALGFETKRLLVTDGWWSVEKGKCVDVPVSQRLYRTWNVGYGTLPRTFYYARTYGTKPLYWRGGTSDKNLCINERRAFHTKQFEFDSAGKSTPFLCAATHETRVRFKPVEDPKANEEYYYLTF